MLNTNSRETSSSCNLSCYVCIYVCTYILTKCVLYLSACVCSVWDAFTVGAHECSRCLPSVLPLYVFLSWRWVRSAAKKEGVAEDVSKYDGERRAVCMHRYCTQWVVCKLRLWILLCWWQILRVSMAGVVYKILYDKYRVRTCHQHVRTFPEKCVGCFLHTYIYLFIQMHHKIIVVVFYRRSEVFLTSYWGWF